MQWLAAADAPSQFFADPSFWLNAGALGVIAGLFVFDKLHSSGDLERVEEHTTVTVANLIKTNDGTVRDLKEAHAQAIQRMDDHVRSLIVERDRANGERNEAIAVMRDFTMMAGAVLNQTPPWGRQSRKGDSGER